MTLTETLDRFDFIHSGIKNHIHKSDVEFEFCAMWIYLSRQVRALIAENQRIYRLVACIDCECLCNERGVVCGIEKIRAALGDGK